MKIEGIAKCKGIVVRLGAAIIFLWFIYTKYTSQYRNRQDCHFAWNMFLLGAVAVLLITVGTYYLNCIKKTAIENVYLFLALTLGILYICVLPPYTTPDEKTHIDMAYQIANELLMGKEEADTGNPLTMYQRQSDVEAVLKSEPDSQVYREIYYNLLKKCPKEEMVETGTSGYSSPAYLHITGILGIIIGQKLHLSTYLMYQLGRGLSGLLFILLLYYAIKWIPFGKGTVIVLALLPTTLQQANSFSYDAIIISMSILFIAKIMNLVYQKDWITWKDMVFLGVFGMLLSIPKGGSYLPLICLVLLIPKEKIRWKYSARWYQAGLMLSAFISFFITNAYSLIRVKNEMKQGIQIEWSKGAPGYTLTDLFQQPFEILKVMLNSFWVKGGEWMESLIGGKLGWFEIEIGRDLLLLFTVVILFSLFRTKENEKKYNFTFKTYLPCLVVFLLSMGIFMVIMLVQNTPLDESIVLGIQGRYFTPVILLTVLTLPFQNVFLQKDNTRGIVEAMWVLQVLTISRIFLFIMIR